MNAKSSMFSGTVQTDPNTIRDTHPLGVTGVALKTILKIINLIKN